MRVFPSSDQLGAVPPQGLFTPEGARLGDRNVVLRYLGTAGFVVSNGQRTLVLDPYLTRAPFADIVRDRPLVPDEAVIARYVPHADDVLVGHAHFDHVLDAPALCARTGARLIGARAVCNVGRAAGLPEAQLVETSGRETIACGSFAVRGLPSRHGKVLFGRVLYPGDMPAPPRWPARPSELKHGLVLNWSITHDDFRIVHVDSADFLREELENERADVLCLCAAGRKYRPNYVAEAVALLRPRYVLPCHWDTMISRADLPLRMIPGIALAEMLAEIRACGAEPLLLPMHGTVSF